MKMGTKSLLFGAHQFLIHPIAVAIGWYKLYGFSKVHWYPTNSLPGVPYDFGAISLSKPMLWLAFIIHDWGYRGLDRMDDERGEMHPRWAGNFMAVLAGVLGSHRGLWWSLFMEGHSRYLSHKLRIDPSPLCAADKMAMVVTPTWLYVLMARATGEIREYQSAKKHDDMGTYIEGNVHHNTWAQDVAWCETGKTNIAAWAKEYADGLRKKYPPNGPPTSVEAGRKGNQVHQDTRQ